MFQDCDVSGNLLQQYEQHLESERVPPLPRFYPTFLLYLLLPLIHRAHPGSSQPSHGIDLKVTVTTKGVWPEKDELASLIIPPHMQDRLEQYAQILTSR
jgi:hypothetical protein